MINVLLCVLFNLGLVLKWGVEIIVKLGFIFWVLFIDFGWINMLWVNKLC